MIEDTALTNMNLMMNPAQSELLERDLREANENTQAVLTVLQKISAKKDVESAIITALETVKSEFNWDYGSYWQMDPALNALTFSIESGSVTPEFQEVTRKASFKEGVGLSGKTWQSRELVFVPDLGTMTDCCRREPAQRAGVKSGVCFPIIVNGQVRGTMDFFSMQTLSLSQERMNALKSVGLLVSSAFERFENIQKMEQEQKTAEALKNNALELAVFSEELEQISNTIYEDAQNSSSQSEAVSTASEQISTRVSTVAAAAEEMSSSIVEISKNTSKASSIAAEAESKGLKTKQTVDQLGLAAKAIGQVVEVIKNISSQTNLLALNATIEAASAGQAGKGFAVVANEVKELAKQAASATEDIKQRIEEIQESTEKAVIEIGGISDILQEINQINTTIASAIEEQSITTNEISKSSSQAAESVKEIVFNIAGLADLANKTADSSQKAKASVQKLTNMSNDIRNLV